MKVLVFGATGMVGQGVLRECLQDAEVDLAVTVGRTATGTLNPKLREIVLRDLLDYTGIEGELGGFDACFFCLGVASSGMKEADYERITYGFAVAAATTLSRVHPGMTFIYVSGSGTDRSERGPIMWARVKGRTENALLRLPLNAAFNRRHPPTECSTRLPCRCFLCCAGHCQTRFYPRGRLDRQCWLWPGEDVESGFWRLEI